jgi:hypothetical protein
MLFKELNQKLQSSWAVGKYHGGLNIIFFRQDMPLPAALVKN